MSAFDAFLNDAARLGDQRVADTHYEALVKEAKRRIGELETLANSYLEANAGNLAMKYSALAQLQKIDPQNPLVCDAALREQISSAAKRAIHISNNWDDVRDLGLNYPIPRR